MSESYEAAVEIREAIVALTEALRDQTLVHQEMLKTLQLIAQLLLEANER